jgi:hypothetical protein
MAFNQAMFGNSTILPKGLTYTENGALSNSTTNDARLDFFSKVLRDTTPEKINDILRDAWTLSPLDTMRLIAQKRDCRGGSGEKKVFYESIRWTIKNYPSAAEMFIPLVPTYGTWKDGFLCFCETELEDKWLLHVAIKLKQDHETINQKHENDNEHKVSVSLCAKWVPSEGSAIDLQFHGVYGRLAKVMGFTGDNKGKKQLRKTYLSPLREYVDIVERLMCGKQWDSITYSHVPSLAMKRLRKAFNRNDPHRFKNYIDDVSKGKQKINAGQLFPHDMVKVYLSEGHQLDQVIEEQWKAYLTQVKELGQLENTIVLSDVSSSMYSGSGPNKNLPILVSIALGLIVSTLTKEPFKGDVITFSQSPTFFKVNTASSLKDQIKQLASAPWGRNTNFQAVFDLILERALASKIKSDDMPKTLVVISDMQFDTASSDNFFTNHETVKAKYRRAGYDLPKIVYWNVAGKTEDFSVTKDEYGVAMVSGFTPCHLKYLTSGVITTPYDLMREAIDEERYSQVDVPPQYK